MKKIIEEHTSTKAYHNRLDNKKSVVNAEQVPIDDSEEKGNTKVTDSEEEPDDKRSSKGAIATQCTSQSQFLSTEEHVRTPARKQLQDKPGDNSTRTKPRQLKMTSCDCSENYVQIRLGFFT